MNSVRNGKPGGPPPKRKYLGRHPMEAAARAGQGTAKRNEADRVKAAFIQNNITGKKFLQEENDDTCATRAVSSLVKGTKI